MFAVINQSLYIPNISYCCSTEQSDNELTVCSELLICFLLIDQTVD